MINELLQKYLEFEKTLIHLDYKLGFEVNNNLYDIFWIRIRPNIFCGVEIPGNVRILYQGTEEQAIESLNNLLTVSDFYQVPRCLYVKHEHRIKD